MIELNPTPPYYPDVKRPLRELNEQELRERGLPDFLRALGVMDTRHRHGPREGYAHLADSALAAAAQGTLGYVGTRGAGRAAGEAEGDAEDTASAGYAKFL